MKTIAESRNRRLETTTGVVDRFTPFRINVKSGCVLSSSKERKESGLKNLQIESEELLTIFTTI
jgi:hypothetical protein